MSVLMKKVDSSNLDTLWHDSDTNILTIKFKGGKSYEYLGVPRSVATAIVNKKYNDKEGQPSSGATFTKMVKNKPEKYPFREVQQKKIVVKAKNSRSKNG